MVGPGMPLGQPPIREVGAMHLQITVSVSFPSAVALVSGGALHDGNVGRPSPAAPGAVLVYTIRHIGVRYKPRKALMIKPVGPGTR